MWPPLWPWLIGTFRLTLAQAGWLMAVFAITGLFLALPAGVALQKLGSKAAGLLALSCLMAGSLWGALAGGVTPLLVSRVVGGVGVALG